MSEWINLDDKWPEDGQKVWLRMSDDIAFRVSAVVKNGYLAMVSNTGHRLVGMGQWMADV